MGFAGSVGIGIFVGVMNENQAVSGLNRIGAEADRLTKRVEKADFSKMRFGLEQMGRLFDPITSKMRQGFDEAMKFEKGMQEVQGALSPKEFREVEKSVRDLSRAMAFKFGEEPGKAAAAIGQLVKAGVDAKGANFEGIAETVAAVAKLEGKNPERVATILTRMSRIFTGGTDAIPMLGGKMVAMANATTASLSELFEAMKYGAPSMTQFGLDMNKQIAFMGLFADAGRAGSLGGTTIGRMLEALAAQSFKSVDNLKLLGKLSKSGFSLSENLFNEKGQIRDVIGFIGELSAQWNRVPGDLKQGLIQKLFGVRGGAGFFAIDQMLKTAPGRFQELLGIATMADGKFAVDQAKARVNNFAGAYDKLGISLKNLASQVLEGYGNKLVPFIQKLGEDVTKTGGAFLDMYRDGRSAQEATAKWGEGAVSWAKTLHGFMSGIKDGFMSIVGPIKMLLGLGNDEGVARFIGKMVVLIPALTALGTGFAAIGLGIMGLSQIGKLFGLGGAAGGTGAGAASGAVAPGGGFLRGLGKWAGRAGSLLSIFSFMDWATTDIGNPWKDKESKDLAENKKGYMGNVMSFFDKRGFKSTAAGIGSDSHAAILAGLYGQQFDQGLVGGPTIARTGGLASVFGDLGQKSAGDPLSFTIKEAAQRAMGDFFAEAGMINKDMVGGAYKPGSFMDQDQANLRDALMTGLSQTVSEGVKEALSSGDMFTDVREAARAYVKKAYGAEVRDQYMKDMVDKLADIYEELQEQSDWLKEGADAASATAANTGKPTKPDCIDANRALRTLGVVHAEASARNGAKKGPWQTMNAQSGHYAFG